MSKKIDICSYNGIRPNLSVLFHRYLIRKGNERNYREGNLWIDDYAEELEYLREMYPGYSITEDDLDDIDIIFPPKSSTSRKSHKKKQDPYVSYWEGYCGKKNKHKSKKGNNRDCKIIDINTPYSGEEENPREIDFDYVNIDDEDDPNSLSYNFNDDIHIYFYHDYHDKEERVEFTNFKDFDEFCKDNGFTISSYYRSLLLRQSVSHCCLNPYSYEDGIKELITEDSYGNMFYEACNVDELDNG